jgi:uncharacterized membrane protein
MIDPVGIQVPNARCAQPAQRWGALLGGSALAVYGVTRRSAMGYALAGAGGALAVLGATANRAPREFAAETSILLNVSPEDAYRFWHDFENLPRFMRHLASVKSTGDRRSHWVAYGPLGARVEWETEIVDERENEFIQWRSLPGSDLSVEGTVEFRPAAGKRGTELAVTIIYRPSAGAVGRSFTKLVGRDPYLMIRNDIRRFKALIETGEVPTTEGQSHGPRDVLTGIVRLANPDRPYRREVGLSETFKHRRRMA